jgi:putative addiction module component (TIGR02574 family)
LLGPLKSILPTQTLPRYPSLMATIFEVEKLALDLPEQDRAKLAADLLDSLPGVLSDEDEGIAEALRRDAEIDADPNQAITLAQLDSHIQSRRS